jgi:hypothetical protein
MVSRRGFRFGWVKPLGARTSCRRPFRDYDARWMNGFEKSYGKTGDTSKMPLLISSRKNPDCPLRARGNWQTISPPRTAP